MSGTPAPNDRETAGAGADAASIGRVRVALDPARTPSRTGAPSMSHERAHVVPTTGARVIAPGVAVLPPLPAVVFLGPVREQAMVVNVRGFGFVVLTGCGHPPIERILGVTEQVIDVPIRAVVGGLHLPVHAWGTPLIPQAVLGNPHWPWQPISERDAAQVMEEIRARGPAGRRPLGMPRRSWRRSGPVVPGLSLSPATTAHRGPATPSSRRSATATA